MQATYGPADGLARRAARLGGPRPDGAPALFLFTDPQRTPDPVAAAESLPPGAGVVYRHFGDPDRGRVAARLSAAARERGLVLLVAADPALARAVGAAGAHWPEWAMPQARRTRLAGFALNSAAAHSARAVARAAAAGMDLAFLSPVFETRSRGAGRPIGPLRARALALQSPLPLYALGGVDARSAARLAGSGMSGFGAVDALG